MIIVPQLLIFSAWAILLVEADKDLAVHIDHGDAQLADFLIISSRASSSSATLNSSHARLFALKNSFAFCNRRTSGLYTF